MTYIVFSDANGTFLASVFWPTVPRTGDRVRILEFPPMTVSSCEWEARNVDDRMPRANITLTP